ncbi:hypothetical protein HDE_03969 [Halotydeus destructor]|nr:hypothetical protein HDE_03969 [Halotydeus destructor]
MAIYTKLSLAAILMVIAATSIEAAMKCAPEDGNMACYKTGLQGGNHVKVTINVSVKSMSYKWQVYKYPCGGKPTGQPVEQKDDQVAGGGQGDRIPMPATNGKTCYYCKMSQCKSGGKMYKCGTALNAAPAL